MTDTLRRALRQDAGSVEIPTLDANNVIAQGEQRLRRRRMTAGLATVAAVAAIAVGSVLVTHANPNTQGLLPATPPSPSHSGDRAVDPHAGRPLVYAVGSTVHVGEETVEARDPVAFIDATDDGAVYESMLDGTLWYTDGTTTSVIGTSGCTACPTAHNGVVTTGDSGSLVVWGDVTDRKNQELSEFVVYDTSRREEVARIPLTEPNQDDGVVYVDQDQVWFATSTNTPSHLLRFDVATGETTKTSLAALDAELGARSRMFVAPVNDPEIIEPGFSDGTHFRQVGRRLVAVTAGGDPLTLIRTNGDEVRLRLPRGFTVLGQQFDASVITLSQWLDDDHIVVWADDGGGDLPAKHGDLLECQLPDGVCHVVVSRSSQPYVTPYRG
jgi:hypothetical protein